MTPSREAQVLSDSESDRITRILRAIMRGDRDGLNKAVDVPLEDEAIFWEAAEEVRGRIAEPEEDLREHVWVATAGDGSKTINVKIKDKNNGKEDITLLLYSGSGSVEQDLTVWSIYQDYSSREQIDSVDRQRMQNTKSNALKNRITELPANSVATKENVDLIRKFIESVAIRDKESVEFIANWPPRRNQFFWESIDKLNESIVSPPDNFMDYALAYQISDKAYLLRIPLWTRQSGKSDVLLEVDLREADGRRCLEFDRIYQS